MSKMIYLVLNMVKTDQQNNKLLVFVGTVFWNKTPFCIMGKYVLKYHNNNIYSCALVWLVKSKS